VELLATEVTVSGAVPLFVSTTLRATDVVPNVTVPKPSAACDRLTDGAGERTAVPRRVAVVAAPGALLLIVRVAFLAPRVSGLSAKVSVHVAREATEDPFAQVPPRTKSPASVPVTVMSEITSAAAPVFVSVTVRAVLVAATGWAPRSMSVASSAMPASGVSVPVPPSVTAALPPAALCAIDRLALRAPVAAGLNTTSTTQLLPPATLALVAQVVLDARRNSLAWVPVRASDDSTRAALPVLLSVVRITVESAPTTLENDSVVGDSTATGAESTAVPDSATSAFADGPLCASVSVPARAPVATGLNTTVTVQLLPMAIDMPTAQVPPVTVKSEPAPVPIALSARVAVALASLVTVTVCAALVVPTRWLANVSDVADRVTAGAADAEMYVGVTWYSEAMYAAMWLYSASVITPFSGSMSDCVDDAPLMRAASAPRIITAALRGAKWQAWQLLTPATKVLL